MKHSEPMEGETCADLGSGRGTDVLRMAEMVGDSGKVYGVDLSDGMIEKAKSTASRMGVENAHFLQSDLESLPLSDEELDLIISNCTINHVSDKQSLWNEVFRTLKKGGRFVVSDIYSTDEVPGEYRNDPEAVAECWAGSVTRELYLQQLANAGFRDVEILEESDPYEKGSIQVVSWTLRGTRPSRCGCQNK